MYYEGKVLIIINFILLVKTKSYNLTSLIKLKYMFLL